MPSTKPIRVFVDSDVVVSSFISATGAAFLLLNDTKDIELYVSNFSAIELSRVTERLNIESGKLDSVLITQLERVEIALTYEQVKQQFAQYVLDPDDAHIVAGAKESKAVFLVTYNIRHFDAEKLKQHFQLIVLTPGLFLQYLRSL